MLQGTQLFGAMPWIQWLNRGATRTPLYIATSLAYQCLILEMAQERRPAPIKNPFIYFNFDLNCSIGRILKIFPYDWLIVGGLCFTHWNKTNLLARRQSLLKKFLWAFVMGSPSLDKFTRNKPGFSCIFWLKIYFISWGSVVFHKNRIYFS